MRIIAAYLLAVLGGNSNPQPADLRKILDSVGVDFDEAAASDLCSKMAGKKVDDVIAAGKSKLGSLAVSSGGAAAPAAGGAAAAPAAGGAAAPAAKEAPKKKEESESEGDMGMGLFD